MVGSRHPREREPFRIDAFSLAAFAISLATAGWSIYAYSRASEITTFLSDEIVVFDNDTSGRSAFNVTSEMAFANFSPSNQSDALVHHDLLFMADGAHLICMRARAFAEYRWIDARRLKDDGGGAASEPACEYQDCINIARDDRLKSGFYHISLKPEVVVRGLPAGETISFRSVYEINPEACPGVTTPITQENGAFDFVLDFLKGRDVEVRYFATTKLDGHHQVSCTSTFEPDRTEHARILRFRPFACRPVPEQEPDRKFPGVF